MVRMKFAAVFAILNLIMLTSASAAPSCSAIPSVRSEVERPVDRVWLKKRRVLEEGIQTLESIRSDLQRDYRWKIGDQGSAREFLTAVAVVTKTATNLTENLVGFGDADTKLLIASVIYDRVKAGWKSYELLEKDAEASARKIALDLGANVHPALRALKATIKFGEDIADIMDLPSNLGTTRKSYLDAVVKLEAQIRSLKMKLAEIEKQGREESARMLLVEYSQASRLCRDDETRGRILSCTKSCDNWFGGPLSKPNAECKAKCNSSP